jgi:SSS family solute:Na+ symporter
MIVGLAVVFLVVNIYIGYRLSNWVRSGSDFLVAGRQVRGWVQFCSFSAIPFAGSALVASPAFVVSVGFWPAAAWVFGLGVIYVVMAFTSMKLLRRSGVYTFGEWVEIRFGMTARQAVSAAQFVGLIFGVAANLAGVGYAMGPLLGWSFTATVMVTTIGYVVYMMMCGEWGNTVNDLFQFCFGALLYVIVFAFAFAVFGLPVNNYNPARVFAFPGNAQVFGLGGPPSYTYAILGWFFFSFAAQHYYIKCASTRSEKGMTVGVAGAGLFTMVWAFLQATIGLYALHLTPGGIPPNQALTAFSKFTAAFPEILQAFIALGYLSAALSTITAGIQANTSIVVRDFYQAIFKPEATSQHMVLPSRLATLVSALLVLWAAHVPGGPAPLLALMAVFMAVSAVLLCFGVLWRRATPRAGTIAAFGGIITGLVWHFVLPRAITAFPGYPVWAGYPVVLVTSVLLVVLSFVTAPKYYGRPEWRFGRERLASEARAAVAGARE